MKALKIILLVLTLLFAQNLLAQSGWYTQNSGTNNDLNSIYFTCLNVGWAVGDNNTVISTADGGANWTVQNAGASGDLHSVFFIDLNTGWIVGEQGSVRKTTNSGINWFPQTSGVPTFDLYSVTFTDINMGHVVGNARLRMRTTNGGDFWTAIVQTQPGILYSVYFPPSAISFTGYAVGGVMQSSIILKTVNAGLNWDLLPFTASYNLYGVNFPDIDKGWAVGDSGMIITTSNAGINWTSQSSGTYVKLSSIDIKNYNDGWISGDSGKILNTTNGGDTWKAQLSGTTNNLNYVFFATSQYGWAVGSNGTILHTTTGGITSVKNINTEIPTEYFLKQNYPNPFNPSTTVEFKIPKTSEVKLTIYDVLGKEIAVLVNENLNAGSYTVDWPAPSENTMNNVSGVYFYRLETEQFSSTKKMVLLK